MRIETFVTDALGDASHVLIDNGAAAVVDPQRDIRPYVAAIERAGARLEYVFETHVHNDYISGGRELAALGATVVAPDGSGLEFPHVPLSEGETIAIGGAKLAALAAPGHTYEHTAYLATPAGLSVPSAAFTGGSLLMGSAGRSDLLGPDHADRLAREQWETAHRIAAAVAPDAVLYPTHGAGSFCSSSSGTTDRFGALSTERGRNPALALPTVEAFLREHLAPAPIPGYYRYMGPINRRGPEVFGQPPSPGRFDAAAALEAMRSGTTAIDLRGTAAFAGGYLDGSISIEFGSSFLAYVGWIVPFGAGVILVVDNEQLAAVATVDLFRIGYENVAGALLAQDIPAAGRRSLQPQSLDDVVAALESGTRPVVDVRFAHEQRQAPIPGAIGAPIEEFPALAGEIPDDAVVICETGYRSTIAASLLRRLGKSADPVLGTGATELFRRRPAGVR